MFKLKADPSHFYIQTACMNRPCFGDIQYGEKGQKHVLNVCKLMAAFAMDGLSFCSVIALRHSQLI